MLPSLPFSCFQINDVGQREDYKSMAVKKIADLWPSETNDVLLLQFITDSPQNAHIYQNRWEDFLANAYLFSFSFNKSLFPLTNGSKLNHLFKLSGPK